MSFVASLKEEKDFWLNCLLEIQAGYKMAYGRDYFFLKFIKINAANMQLFVRRDYL